MKINSAQDMIDLYDKKGTSLLDIAKEYEKAHSDTPYEDMVKTMTSQWLTMKEAIRQGLDPDNDAIEGKIIGREAIKLTARFDADQSVCGVTTTKAMAYALSTMEVNISMGRIVAAPTAGACGVLPGTLLAIQERYDMTDERIVEGLFVAGIVGMVIATKASISGAKGGCQAEIGSAAAMAAAAVVYLLGGTPQQSFDSAAIALNNLMGLICDPVAGLVEVPCHKRNAIGASNALICTEMVLAGIPSIIPFDEVVLTMKQVGDLMPSCHRETATGGVAVTDTAKAYEAQINKGF